MCSSVDVLLPGTLVNHCVSFHGCCLDFALCLKKFLLGYFVLNVMDLLGCYFTIPVRILAYGAVIFWFLKSLELMIAFCIGQLFHFDLGIVLVLQNIRYELIQRTDL